MKEVIISVGSCKDCPYCIVDKPNAMACNANYVCEKTGKHIVNVYMAREFPWPKTPDHCPFPDKVDSE